MPTFTNEIGSSGVPVFEGREADRYLPELQGPDGLQALALLLRREPAAYTVQNVINLTARNATIKAVGASDKSVDRKAADFLDECWSDLSRASSEIVSFALTATALGFADLHIVYKRRQGMFPSGSLAASKYDDGRIGWRKLAIRRQETIDHWETDENGDPKFMVQRNPVDGELFPPVPIERMLHFRSGEDRGAWEGIGWLEPAYRLAHMVSNLELIYGIGQQRAHVGLPVFKFLSKPDGETTRLVETMARRLIVNEQQFLLYPGNAVEFSLETVSNGNGAELREGIAAFRWEIMVLGLAQFLRLGNTSSGSRALADPLIVLFQSSVDAALDNIIDTLNRYAVPRLFQINPGIPRTDLPQFTASSVAPLPTAIMDYLTQIQAWMLSMPQADVDWLRQSLGMPESEEPINVQTPEQQQQQAKDQQAADNPAPDKPAPDKPADEQPAQQPANASEPNDMRRAAQQLILARSALFRG